MRYLGSKSSRDKRSKSEVKNQINQTKSAFIKMKKCCFSQMNNFEIRKVFLQAYGLNGALYGCESLNPGTEVKIRLNLF